MSRRTAVWLAGSLWVSHLLLVVPAIILYYQNDPATLLREIGYPLGFFVFATVGAATAALRPGNPIGWILCVVPVTTATWMFSSQYVVYTHVTAPGVLPRLPVAEWLTTGWVASIGWGLMLLALPLLFPTGRLLSPTWRPLAWLGTVTLGAAVTIQALKPISEEDLPVANPVGIEGAEAFLAMADSVLSLLLMLLTPACVSSMVVRFRRAGEDERQQIKWFALAITFLAAMVVVGMLDSVVFKSRVWTPVSGYLYGLGIASIPVAVAIAILRYRLYGIDLIIRRTLVYGLLTGSLAALYFGGVALLQWILRPLVGPDNEVAVVASTLIIAAVFQPLRRRIQEFIDRRFYRRRYDAARTLAEFGTRLRVEVDLDRIGQDLVAVVEHTMQPAHVTLWLKSPQGRRP